MATDAQSLLTQAQCYLCLGISQAEALQLALLAQVSGATRQIQTARVSATINATTNAVVTATWATPFADTNYTVSAISVDPTQAQAASINVIHVLVVATDHIDIFVRNGAGVQMTAVIHAIAIHD